jgi:hypothetical protein
LSRHGNDFAGLFIDVSDAHSRIQKTHNANIDLAFSAFYMS